MGYAPPPGPSKTEKSMFIIGIIIGALLGLIGNTIVTVIFRIADNGLSYTNGIILIIALIVFLIILYFIPKVVRKLK